jgi:hypothetical protein
MWVTDGDVMYELCYVQCYVQVSYFLYISCSALYLQPNIGNVVDSPLKHCHTKRCDCD